MTGTYTDGTELYYKVKINKTQTITVQHVFLNGNKFYFATDKTKPMKGFRAYFDFTFSSAVKFNFVVDDTPTAIDGISSLEKVADGVYTVSGQKVNESSLEILPKGVYIVNGKKVFKK